ncbi:MAG: nickel pincer cofactor biosynthesis protein LarC [Phycisphaerales bacterium]|nr:nickel pincer cofactor biosynthesis protein LarC [Phycisphaerales bacterium]
MRLAYVDCISGIAGDMLLAALVHAGYPLAELQATVARLRLPDVSVETTIVRRGGIAGTHLRVVLGPKTGHKHRHLPQILELIAGAGLPARVMELAVRTFQRLAEAEAAVHQTTVEKVHFHEVGADDAIVDIVGACAGFVALEIDRVIGSPVPTGNGTVQCDHGTMPIPAPATAELLRGVPLAACDELGELTTPTGAALLTTLAESFGPLPALTIERIGYGAGTRENHSRPNLLRLLIGTADAAGGEADQVVVLETQLDDVTGQVVGYALERVREAGALDAYVVPIGMKKGRPGQLLTVLVAPADVLRVEEVLFRETPTLGVRRFLCERRKLTRTQVSVATPYGEIRIKVGRRGAETLQAWPEYEDCAAAARARGVALRQVQAAALAAWSSRSAADEAAE